MNISIGRNSISVFLAISQLCYLSIAHAASLTIDSYVSDVENKNVAVVAAKDGQRAARVQAENVQLQFLPTLQASAEADTSHQDTFVPVLYGNQTIMRKYIAEIDEKTRFGLRGSLGYNFIYQDVSGADPQIMPVPTYYSATPTLSLTQSLWRNWAGHEDLAQESKNRADAQTGYYSELLTLRSAEMDARNAYTQVYYLRKTMAALKESLGLTGQLRDWARKRATNELADESDFLQTDANYRDQELKLVKTEIDLKSANVSFNSLLNNNSDELNDDLTAPELKIPDLKSLDKMVHLKTMTEAKKLESTKADSLLHQHDATPTLEVYGTYGYSDVDLRASTTLGNSFGKHDIYSYGIRFKSPLAFGISDELRHSFQTQVESSEKKLYRQRQDEARDREILVGQIENAKARYELSQKLQVLQKKKFENEERRHRSGRTTLFQVLQFQQDYLKSELDEIQIELELHSKINQLALYAAQSEQL